MHRDGIRRGGDGLPGRYALIAIGGLDSDLDQFVRGERAIDLGDHTGCRPGMADADEGVERVRAGFEVRAFARREIDRHARILIGARRSTNSPRAARLFERGQTRGAG